MTATINANELQSDLDQFTGTEHHYKHWTNRIVYTDGVQFLAEKAGAYWLIDLVASWQLKAKVAREEFQLWILAVDRSPKAKKMAYARCYTDTPLPDNSNQVAVQGIEYTDFPLDEIKLYVCDRVLMLPGEY